MVDVAVSTQLQQWSFDKKSVVRPERSDSSASSPDLYPDPETLRIDTSAVDDSNDLDSKSSILQERYMSSEEDLSPAELDSDDESLHEIEQAVCFSARRMSIAKFENGQSSARAVTLSFVFAGKPKMIDLQTIPSPPPQKTTRSASLAQLPIPKIRMVEQSSRHSLIASASSTQSFTSAQSSAVSLASSRAPSFKRSFTQEPSALRLYDTSSVEGSSTPQSSAASINTEASEKSNSYPPLTKPSRSSTFVPAMSSPLVPFPPLTPSSPGTHAFLSSDPYENSTTSAASPIIKSAPHKRLRSISQKLSLAKIAISPSSKKWDGRPKTGGGQAPPTPGSPWTPMTPTTPQTAPITGFSPRKAGLRRASRMIPRGANEREPTIELPPLPGNMELPRKPVPRLVPRGASEREPPLELPAFPDADGADSMMSIKSAPRLRKRKSLMDLI